jgi:hypothetical protein
MDTNILYRFRNWEAMGSLAVDLTAKYKLRMENESLSATQLWYFEPISTEDKTYRIRNTIAGPCPSLAQTLGDSSYSRFSAQVVDDQEGSAGEWMVYPLYIDNTRHLTLENKVGLTLIAGYDKTGDVYPVRENRDRPTSRAYWQADAVVKAPWANTC